MASVTPVTHRFARSCMPAFRPDGITVVKVLYNRFRPHRFVYALQTTPRTTAEHAQTAQRGHRRYSASTHLRCTAPAPVHHAVAHAVAAPAEPPKEGRGTVGGSRSNRYRNCDTS